MIELSEMHFDRFAQYSEIICDYSEMDITKVYETFIWSSNLHSRAKAIRILVDYCCLISSLEWFDSTIAYQKIYINLDDKDATALV